MFLVFSPRDKVRGNFSALITTKTRRIISRGLVILYISGGDKVLHMKPAAFLISTLYALIPEIFSTVLDSFSAHMDNVVNL